MIKITKSGLNEDVVNQLIQLSKDWVEEDISHGLVENTIDDLKEPLFIALDNDIIVGYTFGHFYDEGNKISLIPEKSKCFMIDELYVKKEYRDQGIGRRLFKEIEKCVLNDCEFITLATSDKDYHRILHFYDDISGMTFHSAFLVKKTK